MLLSTLPVLNLVYRQTLVCQAVPKAGQGTCSLRGYCPLEGYLALACSRKRLPTDLIKLFTPGYSHMSSHAIVKSARFQPSIQTKPCVSGGFISRGRSDRAITRVIKTRRDPIVAEELLHCSPLLMISIGRGGSVNRNRYWAFST